jgi:four helix bundle protein
VARWKFVPIGTVGLSVDFLTLIIQDARQSQEISTMFNFEKLDVWHKGVNIAELVYRVTRNFPNDERFGLTSQMRRAAASITSNLAEGSSRSSRVDFARFVELASGSLFELVSQAMLSKQQSFLSEVDYSQLHQMCEEQSKMLSGLHRSLLRATQ